MMTTPTLTTTDVAERFAISTRTVQRWVSQHGLPHQRKNNRGVVINENELRWWLRKYSGMWHCDINPTARSRIAAFVAGAE